jgi:tetratricopeptide (TPR) repeat protein
LQISRLDYRVRQHIFSQLRIDAEEQNCANCRENAAYQTALCYRLGFGVKRDVRQASYWLTKSQRDGKFAEVVHFMSFTLGESHELLDDKDREKPYMDVEIMLLRLLVDDDPYHSAKMNSLYTNGVLASVDYAAEYSADGALVLEGVCDTYKREAADIAEELGYDHDVPFMIRNILSWLLKAAGQLKDAKKIAQEHYEFLKNQAGFGPEHSETITELSFLAELCHEEGDFEASLSQLQEVLAIQQKTMKPDDLNAMNTFNNLAEVYQDAGEYALAEDYANRALSGRLKILGEQNVDTLISMNNLGTTWIAQDKLDEAEELLSRAESVSTRILGETNYYTLTIVNNLGATLFFQDKFAEARDKLTTSLASCRITRGPSHPATSTSMNFFISQGDNNAARELCKTAAQNLEQKLGREHPSTLEAKESMIRIAEGDHDYPLAEALSRSLLEISKHVLGENHTKTLNRADTLASMFMNSGKLSEAIELYQWVLQMKEMQLGKDDPQTLITVHNLGSAFNNQNRYKEAQELLLRAYEGFLVCRGPHHSSTLMSMGKLASAYGGLRKLDIAEKMAREAVAGFKQLERRNHEEEEDESEVGLLPDLSLERDDANLMGVKEINEDAMDESPSTLNAMLILGMILERGDRETEAEPLYRHILRGFESLFRPDSHDALATRVSLCRVLSEQGKYEAAMEMALRAESGLEELLGSDHPDTIFARSNVSNLKNRLREAEVRASKPQNN